MMVKRIALYLFTAIVGAALGVSSALYMSGLWPGAKPLDFGNVEIDGWRSDFALGSKAADPYTRARVARHGLLALAKSEAVYFTRTTDDRGEPLRDTCSYEIEGGVMPAGWWSLTLYDGNSMLPANDDDALSFDASRAGTGDWHVTIAPNAPRALADAEAEPAWISNRNAGQFDVTLRLYMPSQALLDDPEDTLVPPKIYRGACFE